MGNEKATLTVVTVETSKPKQGIGLRGDEEKTRKLKETSIPLDQLGKNFRQFLNSLEQIFLDIGHGQVGDFLLEDVTFSAEIGANGEFKLLGTGAGVSASSGVTFTLRRQPAGETTS